MSIRITCINKDSGYHSNPYEAITHLGWVEDGTRNTGVMTRIEMYNWINGGGYAYVKDNFGNEAQVVTAELYGTKYVKTKADHTTSDNLLKLPECPR